MRSSTRFLLAAAVAVVGAISSAAMSQNNKICVASVSCGDRKAPCQCLMVSNQCRVCTGTTIGNFCFDCPGSTCISTGTAACGQEYQGVCVQVAPGTLACLAATLIGNCTALRC